jgi:hypothetical protein
MALYTNNHNLQRFSPPRKSPRYSLYRSLGGPQNWSGRCGEEKHLAPAGNPNPAPARCPLRRHGHRNDKNGVYSTSYLFFTWFQSSIASSMRAWSYQPHPSAIRAIIRELFSRGNGYSERTPRKTLTDCYLRAAAWQRRQEKNALPLCWAAAIVTYPKRTDPKENTSSA